MKQEGGNESTNFQIGGNVTIGVTYNEARQIALDIFKSNFYEFSEKAAKKALERAEEITEKFVKKFLTEIPELISKLEEPSVQSSMFNVQKEYAKTGDKELEKNLLDILIERIRSDERSLKQIVLDEAILLIPKLTTDQINVLTLIFSLIVLNNTDVNNIPSLLNFIDKRLVEFYPEDINSYSFFTHLQFTGCCTILPEGGTYKPIEEVFRERYKGIFSKGFSETQFETDIGDKTSNYPSLLRECLRNPNALQFNALTSSYFNEIISHYNPDLQLKLKGLFESNVMSANEIKEWLISTNKRMEGLLKAWKESALKSITLTSVGNVIALINYKKHTGENLPIDIII